MSQCMSLVINHVMITFCRISSTFWYITSRRSVCGCCESSSAVNQWKAVSGYPMSAKQVSCLSVTRYGSKPVSEMMLKPCLSTHGLCRNAKHDSLRHVGCSMCHHKQNFTLQDVRFKECLCLQCEVKVNRKVNTLENWTSTQSVYSLGQRCDFLWNDISPTTITTIIFLPVTLMNTLNMNSGYTRKYSGGFMPWFYCRVGNFHVKNNLCEKFWWC